LRLDCETPSFSFGKGGRFNVKKDERLQEARWLIVKAMLDEYPDLREKVKKYLMKDVASI